MAQARFPSRRTEGESDIAAALRALDAEELRTFIGETLERLEPDERVPIEDALLRRAAARGGYRPVAPAPEIVDEVVEFAKAARRAGFAVPSEVDEYLRHGVTASLAAEHARARRIFEAILPPIAGAEIDLGQHERVEEVLSVDLDDLEASSPGEDHCESEPERWLRDAVARREGTDGLARIARATKRPQAVAAWCGAVVEDGDWTKALSAYEEAIALVPPGVRHGDLLDGAALAASKLGRKNATKKLEAAWIGAPSLAPAPRAGSMRFAHARRDSPRISRPSAQRSAVDHGTRQ
jgi:hypothetical protein